MLFTVILKTSPTHASASTAYHFIESVYTLGHQIAQVFFFGNGVYIASTLQIPPQDEINMVVKWEALAKRHQFPLLVCAASSLRRGILTQDEANNHKKDSHNMADGFHLSGLGQLMDACARADRVVQF